MAALQARCPIMAHAAALTARGELDSAGEARLREWADAVVDQAMAFADASPFPAPSQATTDVW
jgi:pyruvate dehydrogenase E1 component alpha subunit